MPDVEPDFLHPGPFTVGIGFRVVVWEDELADAGEILTGVGGRSVDRTLELEQSEAQGCVEERRERSWRGG